MSEYQKDSGSISEWDERNFKSQRLNDAQVLINKSKMNPFKLVMDKQNGVIDLGYVQWFNGIIIYYGEGYSKYSDGEFKDCENLKEEIQKLMAKMKIVKVETYSHIGYGVRSLDVWGDLIKKLEYLEYTVKKYNDKHGLTTQNKQGPGMF